MKHALFVIPLMLTVLAAAPSNAAADTDDATAPDRVALFGMTLCTMDAPADADCDIRLGSHPNATHALGMTICTGPVPTGIRCDVDLAPKQPQVTASAERIIEAARSWMAPMLAETAHADRAQ